MSPKLVAAVFIETLLWLPLCFFVWYKAAVVLTVPVGELLGYSLQLGWGEWIAGVKQHGYLLEVTTHLEVTSPNALQQTALFAFDLNPLMYGYGLPFFVALTLAAPQSLVAKLGQILLVGIGILLPVQVFGLVMTTLTVLVFQTPALGLEVSGWAQSFIALGYQFGTLVLPSLVPLLAWLFFNRGYLQALRGG